jgi:AraC-like DNA-binding protein
MADRVSRATGRIIADEEGGYQPKYVHGLTIKVERQLRLSLNYGLLIRMNSNQFCPALTPGPQLPRAATSPISVAKGEPSDAPKVSFGNFSDDGFCLSLHEFSHTSPFEWSSSFRPQSLGLCLNLGGTGSIESSRELVTLQPGKAGFFVSGKRALKAWREPGEAHQFVTLRCSADFLRSELGGCDGALHPLVERFLAPTQASPALSETFDLTLEQQRFITEMRQVPVPQGARALWFNSKVLQLLADFFFVRTGEDELFCDRQKRLARERVNRTISLLKQRLTDPPSLQEIGRVVGCSPFYLSRTFSREMQLTIPQYIRKLRMELAAELLRSGRFNVTEAALEVGYSSLSHFSQAFCQTIGCCPALYPLQRTSKANP